MEPDEDVAELLRRGVSPVPAETVERSVDAVLGRLRADKAARTDGTAGTAGEAPPGQPATAAEAVRTAECAECGTPVSDDAGDAAPAGEVPPAGAPDVDLPDPVSAAAPVDRHAAALPEGCGSVS